jgi:hypothetical protein
MQVHRKHIAIALSILIALLTVPGIARAQQPRSLVASAKGEGIISLGKEKFKIYAVVVKLFEDGKAEINLVTDITVFISGTWSRGDDAERAIDLKITGNVAAGNLDGGGKLFLGEDRKSIAGLKLEVLNKTSRKIIKADFVAKPERSLNCRVLPKPFCARIQCHGSYNSARQWGCVQDVDLGIVIVRAPVLFEAAIARTFIF